MQIMLVVVPVLNVLNVVKHPMNLQEQAYIEFIKKNYGMDLFV